MRRDKSNSLNSSQSTLLSTGGARDYRNQTDMMDFKSSDNASISSHTLYSEFQHMYPEYMPIEMDDNDGSLDDYQDSYTSHYSKDELKAELLKDKIAFLSSKISTLQFQLLDAQQQLHQVVDRADYGSQCSIDMNAIQEQSVQSITSADASLESVDHTSGQHRHHLGPTKSYYSSTCIKTLSGHRRPINSLDFEDPQGLMVSGGEDGELRVYDLASFNCIRKIQAHDSSIRCIKMSDDIIFSGGDDCLLKMWRLPVFQSGNSASLKLRQNNLIRVFDGQLGSVQCVDVCRQNNLLLSGGADNLIKVYDLESGSVKSSIHLQSEHDPILHNTVHSPYDSHYQINNNSALSDGVGLQLLSKKAMAFDNSDLAFQYQGVNSIQFNTDGTLVCGSHDGHVRIFDVRCLDSSHRQSIDISAHTMPVTKVQQLDHLLISSSLDGTIKVQDLRRLSQDSLDPLATHSSDSREGFLDFSVCAATQRLVAAGDSCAVDVISNFTLSIGSHQRHQLEGHLTRVNTVALRGSKLLSAGNDCVIKVWEL
ncbi:hypothetical protein MP228_007419 [Amoeboaphelidium protococcarum]|nr:hypothetical protein MP228_007419 [Amoeboaphelidium protococcarum]